MPPAKPLPLPPLEIRALVGPTEESILDEPTGESVVRGVPESARDDSLDLGCGCRDPLTRQISNCHRTPVGSRVSIETAEWSMEAQPGASHAPSLKFVH